MDYQIIFTPTEVMEMSKKMDRPITYAQAQYGLGKAIDKYLHEEELRWKVISKALDIARNSQTKKG